MHLQYVSDNEGNHTAVLVPIEEWREITSKLQDIDLKDKQVSTDKGSHQIFLASYQKILQSKCRNI